MNTTSNPAPVTFADDADLVTFDSQAAVVFKVDPQARTITGLVLPYDVVGDNGRGKYQFSKGTVPLPVDASRVKLLVSHDFSRAVGHGVKFEETDQGVVGTFKVARGADGDLALSMAEDKVWDGLSAGIARAAEFKLQGDVFHAVTAPFVETSLTPLPAFDDARVTSVAASAAQIKENTNMKCTKCDKVHAAGVTECEAPSAGASFSNTDGVQLMGEVQALTEKIAELEKIKIPVGPGAQLQVTEEPIYRFGGTEPAPSGFDFATDLLAAAKDGDGAALARLKKFTSTALAGPTFADQPTTTGDTAAVNPSQYRADMFLGQAPVPASPLYDFFHKGGLKDVTPFFWSKLDRTNTDVGVGDHTEGTDPESRDLVTASGATVTPTPVSGKVHLTREVGDQGGNPQVSGLIWSEFERSFKIALETKTAALIQAATITELGAVPTAGSTDGAAVGAIVEAGLVGLQFLADGFRFERAFGHIDLYKLLAAATKGTDNADKLYPIINPVNSSGQATSKWSRLDIGGYGMYPAASLGATNVNQKSIVADPTAVHVWNSGLHRLDKLQETVEGWDVGVFGYFAGIVYDVTGLRKITYDVTA